MASDHSTNIFATTLLHSSMFLPDDIWKGHSNVLSILKPTKNNNLYSINQVNDSQLYSTVDEIDTSCLFSDDQITESPKPRPPTNKHKRIQFKDQIDQLPPSTTHIVHKQPSLSTNTKNNADVKSIRFAIDSLAQDQPTSKSSTHFMRRRPDIEQQVLAYLDNQAQFDEHRDTVSTEFNNLMRMASESTRKMLRKIKSGELMTSPKKLWRRTQTDVTEAGSSESLSSAGPSGLYHLPQDMSSVSNTPATSTGTSDMDTPYGQVGRMVENYWGENESQGAPGLLRRKASGALKYMQKWKVASKVGNLIPRSRTRNAADVHGGETVWNSTSEERGDKQERSVRKRLARSLSF